MDSVFRYARFKLKFAHFNIIVLNMDPLRMNWLVQSKLNKN